MNSVWWVTVIIATLIMSGSRKAGVLLLAGLIVRVKAGVEIFETYGGNGRDEAYSIVAIPSGGYYLMGRTKSFGISDGDVWVLRLESEGELLWDKTSGYPGEDIAYSGAVTDGNGCVAAGYAVYNGESVPYILKLSADGNIEWQSFVEVGTNANGITVLSNGDYLIVGYAVDPVSGALVARLRSQDRTVAWHQILPSAYEFREGLELDNGEIAVVGHQGNWSCAYVRLSSIGEILIEKTDIKYPSHAFHQCMGMTKVAGNNIVIAGATRLFHHNLADGYMVKINLDGDILWNKLLDLPNHAAIRSVKELINGELVFSGYTRWQSNGGNDINAFITNKDGDLTSWYKKFGGVDNDQSFSVCIGSDGAIALGGTAGDSHDNFFAVILLPDMCTSGQYFRFSTSSCEECVDGTFNTIPNSAVCTPCSPGFYQDGSSPTLCQPCSPGTHQSSSKQASCDPCLAGTYQDESGQTDCKKCPPNSYQDEQATVSCKACPIGEYQPLFGQSSCLPCHPLCKHCYGPGNTECSECWNDITRLDEIEGTTCDCTEGFFHDSSKSTHDEYCQPCGIFCGRCIDADNCLACVDNEGVVFEDNVCKCQMEGYTEYLNMDTNRLECIKCHPLCNECYGPSKNECYSCASYKNATFLLPSTCECHSHYYYNETANNCTECHELCTNCISFNNCEGCNTAIGFSVEGNPSLCVYECDDGYFRDGTSCKRMT